MRAISQFLAAEVLKGEKRQHQIRRKLESRTLTPRSTDVSN